MRRNNHECDTYFENYIFCHNFRASILQILIFQVLGAHDEYHFVHYGLPQARSKRSVRHVRMLKSDPHVSLHLQFHFHKYSGIRFMKTGGYNTKKCWGLNSYFLIAVSNP